MTSGTANKIPHPPRYPFIGNLPQIVGENLMQNLLKLAEHYGPLFEIVLPQGRFFAVTNHELGKLVMDDALFEKKVALSLNHLRHFAGDGLFTARNDEPNWAKAHNILMPGFGMRQMVAYVPQMFEIAEQMIEKWERHGHEGVDVPEDFTRLTLDTIALCGFDYRFHSFKSQTLHPFLDAMVYGLQEAVARMKRTKIQQVFKSDAHFIASRDLMFQVVDELIQERIKNIDAYQDKVDFLSLMMNGIDKKSGSKMEMENIRYNLITFLVAGHETTSGLLSFATYWLMKNPEIQKRAREEVDAVLGRKAGVCPDWKQIGQLKYINQILKETLRITPSVPFITRTPRQDIMLGDQYLIKKDDVLRVFIASIHKDPAVWDQPNSFDPERFSAAREASIPEYAFKPFGTGDRSCIGQHFAMVEASISLALVLKHFEIIDDRGYELEIKETITLKPKDFTVTLKKRPDLVRDGSRPVPTPSKSTESRSRPTEVRAAPQHATPLAIYYGSNMGSTEDFAMRMGQNAKQLGFVCNIAPLDDAVEALPNTGAILILSSTYNGLSPDNAKKFAAWIKSPEFKTQGVKYAVFGCGNTQWKTFQAFPRDIDAAFHNAGAVPLLSRGETDANGDFEGGFERWCKGFWLDTLKAFDLTINPDDYLNAGRRQFSISVVEESEARPLYADYDAKPFRVLVNRELQRVGGDDGSERATRHIELQVPIGFQYSIGDHIGVFAQNRDSLVVAVAKRLGYGPDTLVTLRVESELNSFLPLGQALPLRRLLGDYCELQEVASRKTVSMLAGCCMVESEKQTLLAWSAETVAGQEAFAQEVLGKRRSTFDLLLHFKSCELPLDLFFELVGPIRPRYYSISSSPWHQKDRLSITVGIVAGPALSENGSFKGLCSSYLQSRDPGDEVWGFVKSPSVPFRLPEEEQRPILMVGPGTGIAPFRGFLQERAHRSRQGMKMGEAHLFFGCRRRALDFLYEAELQEFTKQGVCTLYLALSHEPDSEFKFVQDRIWEQRDKVWNLLESNAVIYVCGDGLYMAPDVRETFKKIYSQKKAAPSAEAEAWMEGLENSQRYLTDVFGQKKA